MGFSSPVSAFAVYTVLSVLGTVVMLFVAWCARRERKRLEAKERAPRASRRRKPGRRSDGVPAQPL